MNNPYKIFNSPRQLYFFYEAAYARIRELKTLIASDLSSTLDQVYQLQLVEAQHNLEQIREILEGMTDGECVPVEQLFSRERSYAEPMILWFKKDSYTSSALGPSIKGNLLLNQEEAQLMIHNLEKQIYSYGRVRFQPVNPSDYTEKQLHLMQTEGIESCDIDEIW